MLIAFLFDTIGRYLRYRSQLASMVELDDRTLTDIGLNRGELERGGLANGLALGAALTGACSRICKKARANAGLDRRLLMRRQCLISGGSLPPFAASFAITCLCSQTFMLAESLLSPV